jgi:translation initiation factor IF-2
MKKRPPVIVVMGHVDHGKTTLLDYIRKTNIAGREAGGITQAIGAYEIERNGQKLTFIDTPGHEAFSGMRYHGTRIADLAILVIAAEDGVKPQTKDALKYILQEKLPFVVAINKIDKTGVDIEKTKQDLSQNGVYLEGYGGNISWHAISAKTGEGVEKLLDLVTLATEMETLEYDPDTQASGIVTSVKLDPQKGVIVAGVLENGRLETGYAIITESASGKVKIMNDFLGRRVESLEPSSPVIIIGFNDLPQIGEEFFAAKEPKIPNPKQKTEKKPAERQAASDTDEKTLALILKADEAGSLEALKKVIGAKAAEFGFRIIASSVGNIHETDVKLAESGGAVILGFRVKTDKAGENLARSQKNLIITSSIIYELEKEIAEYGKKFCFKEVRCLEILGVFGQIKGKERVVGGKIILGPVKNGESFEIWQDKKLIGKGKILNLQSQHKNIIEGMTGQEVGMLVDSEEPIKVGERLIFA